MAQDSQAESARKGSRKDAGFTPRKEKRERVDNYD
jgi:hypothetical protein